jgi:hypothetical protein
MSTAPSNAECTEAQFEECTGPRHLNVVASARIAGVQMNAGRVQEATPEVLQRVFNTLALEPGCDHKQLAWRALSVRVRTPSGDAAVFFYAQAMMIRVMGINNAAEWALYTDLAVAHLFERFGVLLVVAHCGPQAYQATFELPQRLAAAARHPGLARAIGATNSGVIPLLHAKLTELNDHGIPVTTATTGHPIPSVASRDRSARFVVLGVASVAMALRAARIRVAQIDALAHRITMASPE